MPATIPREYLQALTQGMDAVIDGGRESARALLEQLIADSDGKGPLDIVEEVAEVIEPLMQSVSEQTAALSAQSYDMLRTAVTGEAFGAVPYAERDERWTKRALWGIAGDHRDNMDAFIQGVLDRVDYEAKRAAGRTTFQNGKKDPKRPRYARVPTGAETCKFCIMLASRGFVYHSEQTAGALDHYHPNCKCRIVAGYDGMTIDGYDPDEYLRLWERMEDEGIDRLPSKEPETVRPTSSIDRAASVYAGLRPEYVDRLDGMYESAPEANQTLYKRFESGFGLVEARGEGAYFSPSDVKVRLDPEKVLGDADTGPKLKGATWFHEFGHSIDYMSTGTDDWYGKLARMRDEGHGRGRKYTYASVAYKDGIFGRTLKKEVNARINAVWDELKKEKKEKRTLFNALDFDTMLERGYLDERQYERFRQSLKTAEEYARVVGTEPKDEFMETSFAKLYVRNYIDEPAKKANAQRLVSEEIMALDHSHNDAISDIFEGATRGKVHDYWGHGKAYWKDGDNVPIEAFAEFYSAEMMDPEAVSVIERYFPESKKVFDELVGFLAEGGDPWQT